MLIGKGILKRQAHASGIRVNDPNLDAISMLIKALAIMDEVVVVFDVIDEVYATGLDCTKIRVLAIDPTEL
tara:strand:- start:20 stop:232 length:213 start_codon:yes stop_codon:yes gene_type:complete